MNRCYRSCLILLCLLLGAGGLKARIALDEESPWPRTRATNGNVITLYAPQVETWTSNSFSARAAVEVKLPGEDEVFGVVWFNASGSVDHEQRVVTLDRFEISRARFPEAKDQGSNAVAAVRDILPVGASTVSLDYLLTTLGFDRAVGRQGEHGYKHEPPEIVWVTNRAVLVRIDGDPVTRPIPGSTFGRVINSPALILSDSAGATFYLSGAGRWFTAAGLQGPWSPIAAPPPELAAVCPQSEPSEAADDGAPTIVVRTGPAELLTTIGLPEFRSVKGTGLQYAANSDSQLFFHTAERKAYILLSGRWFKADSLQGPWSYVLPQELPADFARIPPGSPQAIVLASVPGTSAAEVALLANSVPTTATVNRSQAKLQISYDGPAQFKQIETTSLTYAVNADLPVIRAGDKFYALEKGVWFSASSANGPWLVAVEVPDEIYSIPPSSPLYYVTFARVYDSNGDAVEVGYTPGYTGAYEDDGTVVYGTGWSYSPWVGDDYYGWGWTWGYGYSYVPWYQIWAWRPWWTPPGGLRAALIENIYNRWQGDAVVNPL